jgi:L-alanine-DL-glutamate epimerase-like enolase superfamily enzyme
MKIIKIQVYLLQKKLSSSMAISRGGFNVRSHAIVEVVTDQGVTGLGEGVGDTVLIKEIIESRLANRVIGLDPMNIEKMREALIDSQVYFELKGSVICAASAIEMACWDIKGKALGVPVYQLLGGLHHATLDTYASDVYWEESSLDMARNAERILALGFKNIKAHLGCRPPRDETQRVSALRAAVGDDAKLMIDLNAGYTRLAAAEASRLWEQFQLYWLEEPLHPAQLDAMADLRRQMAMPLACGENEFRLSGFKQLFDKHAVDVAMPDIGRAGGIQETKNISVLAEAYGITISPHNFSSGILLAATIQLMASTSNAALLEYDSSGNAVYQDLLVEPLEIKDGRVTVPHHPGLGVHLPTHILKQYAVH